MLGPRRGQDPHCWTSPFSARDRPSVPWWKQARVLRESEQSTHLRLLMLEGFLEEGVFQLNPEGYARNLLVGRVREEGRTSHIYPKERERHVKGTLHLPCNFRDTCNEIHT